ncbi:replication initiation protein [Butyrivibrio fibrisolvens]|uniref:replication initiation protein n=1 Tax=Butyrivibrio fibrisolvens TaxID=831 RepID=UPI0003B5C198|nr:replication initiation protein [Butyrivibrio fibrisolvens]
MAVKNTPRDIKGMNYKKSNIIIGAKYKSTIYENKLLAAALYSLQNAATDKNGDIVAVMPASQLKEIFGRGNSIYSHLKPVAASLIGRSIGIEDDEKKEFHYMTIVTDAEYKDGVCTITFNKKLKEKLLQIQNKFTLLSLPVMMDMTSVYSFRLYELLKSEAFIGNRSCQMTMDGGFEFYIGLSELKLELGVVDASEKKVQEILNGKQKPDYDKAVEVATEKSYDEWRDFKKNVMDVATKEITQKTELDLSYETKRTGRGGKTSGIVFRIKRKDVEEKVDVIDEVVEKKITDDEKYELIDQVKDLMDEKISTKDIISILEAAGYDYEKVKKQYENSKSAKKIANIVGWMIDAIKKDYSSPIEKKGKTANLFNSFQQNEYDFEALENALIDN